MHPQPAKEGKGHPVACSIHHHNTSFFGLAKNDHDLNDKIRRKRDWSFPSDDEIDNHARAVRQVLRPDSPLIPSVSATGGAEGTGDEQQARRLFTEGQQSCIL